MFDEFAWRLLAAGIPVMRVSLHSGTLHPQFLGATYLWWRTTGQTQKVMITHELGDSLTYDNNPVRRVREGREIMRRRLDGPDPQLDFPVLHDLKARGATEYFALPVASAFGSGAHMACYVADRPGGFTERELADLSALSQRLSLDRRHEQPAADRRKRSHGLSRAANRTEGAGRSNPARQRPSHRRGALVVGSARFYATFRPLAG